MAAAAQKRERTERTRESVKHQFSDAETLEMSRQLARSHQELSEIEEQKENVVADFKAQITAKEGSIADLSRRINNGYEYRTVDCELRFHQPEKGMKTLVRMDSGETVKSSKMDSWELQDVLFEEDAIGAVLESVAEQINGGALNTPDSTVTARVSKGRARPQV